ncbi:MAG: type IV secretory system conjugative DNA transfer family protein [Lachnospiraceae bacterium]
MDFRKQIKDFNVDYSARCRQLEELRTECSASEMGVSVLSADLSVSRDYLKTRRNNNILIFDEKEDFYKIELENLKDDKSNYIIVDFDGVYYDKTSHDFQSRGFSVKSINLIDVNKSDGYNPFAYIQNEVDVDVIVRCIMDNTRSRYSLLANDQDKMAVRNLEQTFFKIIISCYMKYGTSKTMSALANLLRSEKREQTLEKLFSGEYPQGPNEMECKRFQIFKQDAGLRYISILDSCRDRVAFFKDESIVSLSKKESILFAHLYNAKQVLYIIIPSELREVELFTSLLLSQITYTLCDEKRKANKDRMVMLYLNYFADAGAISRFERLLPDIQQYNIGCMIHVNNLPRVAEVYSKWLELFESCDTILYLGSRDANVKDYFYSHAGDSIIKKKKVMGKDMYRTAAFKKEEIDALDEKECFCVVRGEGTFLLPKIDAYDDI